MKRVFLILLFITNLHAEISFYAESWFMNWQQDDTPDIASNSSLIKQEFSIDDAFTYEVGTSIRYTKNYIGSISYRSGNSNQDSDNNTLTSLLGYARVMTDYVATEVKYVGTKTSGSAVAKDESSGNSSFVGFNTEINIYNIYLYPNFLKHIVGFGYQYLNYNLPQSIYVRKGDSIIAQMVESNMQWSSNYATIRIANTFINEVEELNTTVNSYFYTLEAGIGQSNASSPTANEAELSSYLSKGLSYFYKADIGWEFGDNFKTVNYNVKLGYRYAIYELTTGENDGTHIYAQANTSLHGPFVNFNMSF